MVYKIILIAILLFTLIACESNRKETKNTSFFTLPLEGENIKFTGGGGTYQIWKDNLPQRKSLIPFQKKILKRDSIRQWINNLPKWIQTNILNKKIQLSINCPPLILNDLKETLKTETIVCNSTDAVVKYSSTVNNSDTFYLNVSYIHPLSEKAQLTQELLRYIKTCHSDEDIAHWYQELPEDIIAQINQKEIKIVVLDSANYINNEVRLIGIPYAVGYYVCDILRRSFFKKEAVEIMVVQTNGKYPYEKINPDNYEIPIQLILALSSKDN